MTLTLGKKVDDPKAWNDEQAKWRSDSILKGTSVGCTDRWACEGCGHLVIDSICLCLKSFTCPGCGYEEKPNLPEYNMSDGKLVIPTYIEYDIHVFNVYRIDDVTKFIDLIRENGGQLQTVVPSFWPNGLSSGWNISYTLPSDKEPLSMEILC